MNSNESVPPNTESATEQPGGINTEEPQYDPGIVPQEVAARREREGGDFGGTKTAERDPESINTTSGTTVDQEGLSNNYAVEPEMYVDEPGDLKQQEEEEKAARAQERQTVNQDEEQGQLTAERDTRGKGPGGISAG